MPPGVRADLVSSTVGLLETGDSSVIVDTFVWESVRWGEERRRGIGLTVVAVSAGGGQENVLSN